MEEEHYRRLVEVLASGEASKRIPNSLPLHAAIVIEAMFRHASCRMRIFTGMLNPDVYGQPELVEAARKFLAIPGSRLEILVEQPRDNVWAAEHPLLGNIEYNKSAVRGLVEVRCATGVYSTPEAKHFAVMDDCGYRFERDHDNQLAVASFNEPSTAKRLTVAFDRAFEMTPARVFLVSREDRVAVQTSASGPADAEAPHSAPVASM